MGPGPSPDQVGGRPGRQWALCQLIDFLTALGRDVRITVKPARKRVGEMDVVKQ